MALLKNGLPLFLLIIALFIWGPNLCTLAGDIVCRSSDKGPGQALPLYRLAALMDWDHAQALAGQAECHKRIGDLVSAQKEIDRAVAINKDAEKQAEYLVQQGEILNLNKKSTWQEPVKEAAKYSNSKTLAITYQKRAYQALYGEAPAEDIYRLSSIALLLDKNLPRAFAYRANAHNQRGDYHRALVDCREGMKCRLTKSDRALLYTQKAEAYYGQGKLDDTVYSAKKALELRPTEDNYTDTVSYLMESGDYDEALALTSKWRNEKKISPQMKMLRKRLFELKGLTALAKDIKDIPWEQDIIADYYYQRSLTFYKAGNYKNALKAANTATSFYKKDERAKAIAMCSEANIQ